MQHDVMMTTLKAVSYTHLDVYKRQVLYTAHYPSSEQEAYAAHKVLERVAAIISVSHLRSAAKLPIIERPSILYPNWPELIKNVPFQLTQEQLDGIEHLMNAFAQSHTTTTLINGDVGMGKSVIYQVAVIAAVKAGARVAILLPNERLAIQAHEEINAMWPDAQALLVNKKTKKDLTVEKLLVGTTAPVSYTHLDVYKRQPLHLLYRALYHQDSALLQRLEYRYA